MSPIIKHLDKGEQPDNKTPADNGATKDQMNTFNFLHPSNVRLKIKKNKALKTRKKSDILYKLHMKRVYVM